MRRKPCEGRNIEDSDADLYAEYHGNNSNLMNSSSDLELCGCQDDQPRPRLRRISGRSDNDQSSTQCRDRFEKFPDLKNTIDFNFQSMYSAKNHGKQSLQGDNSVETESVVGKRENLDREGYNFQDKFKDLYKEHDKFLEEKRQHEELRNHYLENNMETRASRSKSWSEGQFILVIQIFFLY